MVIGEVKWSERVDSNHIYLPPVKNFSAVDMYVTPNIWLPLALSTLNHFVFLLSYLSSIISVLDLFFIVTELRPVRRDLCSSPLPSLVQICFTPCPEHCLLSDWSEWGPCMPDECTESQGKRGQRNKHNTLTQQYLVNMTFIHTKIVQLHPHTHRLSPKLHNKTIR